MTTEATHESQRSEAFSSTRRAALAAAAAGAAAAIIGADPAEAEVFDEEIVVERTSENDLAFAAAKSGESHPRWKTNVDGTIRWVNPADDTTFLKFQLWVPEDLEANVGRILQFMGGPGTSPLFQIGAQQPDPLVKCSPILQFARNNGDAEADPPVWGALKAGDICAEIGLAGVTSSTGSVVPPGHFGAKASQNWSVAGGITYAGINWLMDGWNTTGSAQFLAQWFGNGRVQFSSAEAAAGSYQLIVVNDDKGTPTTPPPSVQPGFPADVVIAAKGAPSQAGDLFQALTSADAVVFKVNAAGKVGIGVASITSGATAEIGGDLYFAKEATRTIKVADTTTAGANGAALNVAAGKGDTSTGTTNGGALTVSGGAAGSGNATGGTATLIGGNSSGGNPGGDAIVRGGGGWISGNVLIDCGSGAGVGFVLIGTAHPSAPQRTGFGVTVPSAFVHIRGGTATAYQAPLKLNSGTNLASPEAGAVEYDGNWRFTKANAIRYAVGGVLFDYYTDAANSGSSETTLYSSSLPASTLANVGEKIVAEYGGTFVDSGSTKQLKAKFDGTTILDTGALTTSAATSWQIRVAIVRDSSNSVRCTATATLTGASASNVTSYQTVGSLNFASALALALTGTATSTNDIVASMGSVSYQPKA